VSRRRGFAKRALAAVAFLPLACARWAAPPVPMRSLPLGHSGPTGRCLVVLLAGRGGSPEDFARARFPELAGAAGVAADFLAADASLAYFLRRSVVDRLHDDVIAPARAHGYRQIWLAGISLGGTVALLYLRERPAEIQGALLVAPYLGEPAMSREVAAAGGLARWNPPPALPPDDLQHRLWAELKRLTGPGDSHGAVGSAGAGDPPMPLYLGFGDRDRFAVAAGLLAAALPADRVFTAPGGHDWDTWTRIWMKFVAVGALPHRAPAVTPADRRNGGDSARGHQ
jgi:pimeloyl-ACP methyl ester carboxylesterase